MNETRTYRRALLGSVAAVPVLSFGGYYALEGDERRIHRPVREWEEERVFEFHAERGESLVIAVDTRRTTPDGTLVQVTDPEGEGVGRVELTDAEPRATFPVERTGPHSIYVAVERFQGRARVWIEITAEDDRSGPGD